MPTINLNAKIKGGPRTQLQVDVYSTSVNEKIIKFGNGRKISDTAIAEWIGTALKAALVEIESRPPKK